MKCQKCIYYKLAIQHDYIIDNQSNAYCLKYDNKCIPIDVYIGKEKCIDYKEDEKK